MKKADWVTLAFAVFLFIGFAILSGCNSEKKYTGEEVRTIVELKLNDYKNSEELKEKLNDKFWAGHSQGEEKERTLNENELKKLIEEIQGIVNEYKK